MNRWVRPALPLELVCAFCDLPEIVLCSSTRCAGAQDTNDLCGGCYYEVFRPYADYCSLRYSGDELENLVMEFEDYFFAIRRYLRLRFLLATYAAKIEW